MIRLNPKLLEEVREIPWFKNCGRPPAVQAFEGRQLRSWAEVQSACVDPRWMAATEEAQAQLTEYLSSKHPGDYQGVWNHLVREARGIVESTAGVEARRRADLHGLGKQFIESVEWDVLCAILEITYKTKNPPTFFAKLLEVYRSGHFPCGIEGDGKLLFF